MLIVGTSDAIHSEAATGPLDSLNPPRRGTKSGSLNFAQRTVFKMFGEIVSTQTSNASITGQHLPSHFPFKFHIDFAVKNS